tara:strand:+ start:44005 stop:44343 length:339 start_codon:yes stop_codon:yes gene_type:complete
MATNANTRRGLIDFARVNSAALSDARRIVPALLPAGRMDGVEWVARNPQRSDRRLGSFKVNLDTGKWADFATGDRGGDLVSLAAFVSGESQRDAAIHLAQSLGVDPFEEAAR